MLSGRRILLLIVVGAVALLTPATALATAPTVTLSDPANGGLITDGQPDFSGTAGDSPADSGTVAIDVYSGTTTGNAPVQVINTGVTNGSYSAKSLGLPDGTYTAVATEDDSTGTQGSSQPVTFQLFNGTPQLTLSAPAPPITTPEPDLTGTAKTDPGDSTTVEVIIYPGTSTDTTPLAVLNGVIQSDGTYTVSVAPGLVNGTYTAVASQQLALSTTFSPPVQFTVSASTATLTVTAPAASTSEPQTGVVFEGSAGADYGDSSQVKLTLYRGATAVGTPVGSATVSVADSTWSENWPTTLAIGTYTLLVTQADTTGETATVTRTFTVRAPGSISGAVAISAAGAISAKVACLAGAGTCIGDVLIVTKSSFQTAYGGPLGPLRLMFMHYSIAASKSKILTAQLSSAQLAQLKRAGPTKLTVSVVYSLGKKLSESSLSTAAVTVG